MTINIDQHLQAGDKAEVGRSRFLNGDLSIETAEVFVPEEMLTRAGEILDKHTDRDIYNFYVMQAWDEMIQFANEYNISKEKLLFILARLSEKYSEQTRQLVDSFTDEMSSEALVQVAGEIMWRPDVAEEFKTTLIGVVKYKYAFDEIYEQELLQAVDFSQPSEVFKISAWLDFLRRLHANAYFDTAKEKSIDIQKTLAQKHKASGDDTIYFLDLQIRDVLQQMDSGLAELDLHRDKFPFEVSRGLYGIHKNGQLYVANLEDSKEVLGIVKRIEILEKSAGGDRRVINRLYNEMMGMFNKPVDLQKSPYLSEEEWKKEYFNYSCLMRKPIREAIKADFGFSLEELSIREQFYFLNYAKLYLVSDVEKLQKFTKQYGRQGARTFLSLEYGQLEMGEKILNIGEKFKENPAIAEAIFGKYAELVDVADNIEDYLKEQFGRDNPEMAQEIADDLLMRGRAILVMFANEELTGEMVLERLGEVNVEVEFISGVIQKLSREDVANIDLRKLKDISVFNNLQANDLRENPALMNKMKLIIGQKFPAENAVELFKQDALSEKNMGITVSVLDGEILSFFMKKKIGVNQYEITWFASNDDYKVRGLGEATIATGFQNNFVENENYYAVAKPYVKSFRILIEKLGFVGYEGSTKDGEYVHHYAKTRRLVSDREYVSKNLTEVENEELMQLLKSICRQENKIYNLEFYNQNYMVAKIVFSSVNYMDDITEGTEGNGWIYGELRRQFQQGNVLTRYIPESYDKKNSTFYAVFEKEHR